MNYVLTLSSAQTAKVITKLIQTYAHSGSTTSIGNSTQKVSEAS